MQAGRDQRTGLRAGWKSVAGPGLEHRLYWIDWLKALTVLGVFGYHAALPFTYVRWLLSDSQKSLILSGAAGLGYLFGMPLMFVLAGAASWFALRKRGLGGFVSARFARLVVPFIAGVILLSPLQAYLAHVGGHHIPGGLLAFYTQFLSGVRFTVSPTWFATYGYHLWFLGFLFAFSVLALPLYSATGKPWGNILVTGLGQAIRRCPALLLLVGLPAVAASAALRPRFDGYLDWPDFTAWGFYYATGYVLIASDGSRAALRSIGRPAAATAAAVGLVALALLVTGRLFAWEQTPGYSAGFLFVEALRSYAGWALILTALWAGLRFFNRPSRFVDYWDEALLPFYVLHHPIIIGVAVIVTRLDLSALLKFGLIVLIAFPVTLGVYESCVRRFAIARVCFGMKAEQAVRPNAAAVA